MIATRDELNDREFERIEAAVMETVSGRWFLQEFARRRRAEACAETLAAIARLEARSVGRDMLIAETRREAARAAATLAETVRRLHGFALGFGADDEAAGPEPTPLAESRQPHESKLGRRLEALQALDSLDVQAKVKLFG